MSPALFLKQALCYGIGFTGVHGAAHKGSGKEFDSVYVQQSVSFIYLFFLKKANQVMKYRGDAIKREFSL